MPETTVVVLNWRQPEATRRCLASLAGQRVLVVDNGSGDGSAEALAAEAPVLALPANGGFAAGMNAGARQAIAQGARYVLLLNNDTVLSPGCVERLEAALDADPTAALAAPTILSGQPPRVWYAGGSLSRWRSVVRHRVGVPGEVQAVSYASGCCLLLRAEAFTALAGLDERYFMYFEDADLCDRLAAAGWRLLYVPRAGCWHAGGASTGSQTAKAPALDYYDLRNGIAFMRERRTRPERLVGWLYLLAVRLPRKLLRVLWGAGDRRASLLAVLAGIRDGCQGVRGPYGGT